MSYPFRPPGVCLDPAQPLDTSHPLNRRGGLLSEWAVLPGGQWGRGTKLRDLNRATQNDGTLTNTPTWAGARGRTGGFGSLTHAGASSQYVDCSGVDAALTGLAAATLSGWFYRNATGTLTVCGRGSGNGDRFGIDWFSDNSIYGIVDTVAAAGGSFTAAVTTTGWHYISMAFDGSLVGVARVAIYLNGAPQSVSLTGTIGATIQSGSGFSVGRFFAGGTIYTTGGHDGVILHNRALTGTEVLALYRESVRGNPTRWRWVRPWAFGVAAAATTSGLLLRRRRVAA